VKPRPLLATILLAGWTGSAHAETFRSKECGATFMIPSTWTAEVQSPDDTRGADNDTLSCSIALRPRGWSKKVARSRWGTPDPPLTLLVFKPSTSYEQALEEIGFDEGDEAGRGFGMPGGYGSFATAQPYAAGRLRGHAAYTFFRGFIRDDALLQGEESRVFSGEIGHLVLKTKPGRVVAFECEGGSPDMAVDCEPVIQRIGRSITFTPP
jgi:hypothetical protein